MKEAIDYPPKVNRPPHRNAGGRYCDVEQLEARLVHTQEVAGSNPAFATVIPHKTDLLAGQRRRAHPTHFLPDSL